MLRLLLSTRASSVNHPRSGDWLKPCACSPASPCPPEVESKCGNKRLHLELEPVQRTELFIHCSFVPFDSLINPRVFTARGEDGQKLPRVQFFPNPYSDYDGLLLHLYVPAVLTRCGHWHLVPVVVLSCDSTRCVTSWRRNAAVGGAAFVFVFLQTRWEKTSTTNMTFGSGENY